MTRWVATAPGKVVLLGEYAVLDGTPALVQAVDRRCRVTLEPCSAAGACIEAPQLGIEPVQFSLEPGGQVQWPDRMPAAFQRTAALIDSVLAHVRNLGGQAQSFRMRIDTSELFDADGGRPVKLGLGSSAASAVAIDAALHAAFVGQNGRESEARTVARLLVPGRQAQGNAGSGIDLAAGLCGGLLAYRISGREIEIARLALPEAIETCFVWAGAPASTADLLAAWRRSRETSPDAHERLLGRMQAVAISGLEAVERGEAARILDCWSEYGRLMGKMNDLVGREIVTAEHRIAGSLAERLGGVYKPCGAGGGDLGLAASLDAGFCDRLQRSCREAGLKVLPIRPAAEGVCVTRE
ncbi:hypothetical protein G4Y73_11570 [Wenzhouxiangella sp. XN201]|uniref:GHMP family kinase ATP-binding protein n=1 Tax=Wenzhouxiangella sp. XN201 TaxID=2710755 RepID=UPI0013C7865A|nr:hypothetical protein [Wenzhouxiangella sp. XN201]